MVQYYLVRIKLGKLTLAEVPPRWREAVAAALEGVQRDG